MCQSERRPFALAECTEHTPVHSATGSSAGSSREYDEVWPQPKRRGMAEGWTMGESKEKSRIETVTKHNFIIYQINTKSLVFVMFLLAYLKRGLITLV